MPLRPVFAGELTTDALIEIDGTSDKWSSLPAKYFTRENMSGAEWAKYVSMVAHDEQVEFHAGGSVANAAASFMAATGARGAYFAPVETAKPGGASRPLWWRGYNLSAADLTARLIRVGSFNSAPTEPETPGALVLLDASGAVCRIVANTQVPSRDVCGPAGTLLVIRADHIPLLDAMYLRSFRAVAVLLSDDGSGWEYVADTVGRSERAWVFGKTDDIADLAVDLVGKSSAVLELIGTDGTDPCIVVRGDKRWLLPVPTADVLVTDLGAGDAYLGGYLAESVRGRGPEDSHRAGTAAARTAMAAKGARAAVSRDLNRHFPEIGRRSLREDEGDIFSSVRTSPGVTVLTGGQTGIDTLAAKAAIGCGLPVHAIFPKNFRQEGGVLSEDKKGFWKAARLYELGSPSFRYRTWSSVYMSDGVILADRAGGEGSRETAIAAEHMSRPLLDIGSNLIKATEISGWLASNSVRIVLIAGSRASLMSQASLDEHVRPQMEEVARGVCMRNARLLGSDVSLQEILNLKSRVGIAMPTHEWVSCNVPYIERLSLPPVLLSSRDVAKTLETGELDVGITWPSLLAEDSLKKLNVAYLGCFPVHYGFLLGEPTLARGHRIAVQYRHAFARHAKAATPPDAVTYEIEGRAEEWIEHGRADAAYDSYRTGRTSSGRRLEYFFPTHWETLAAIYPK